MKILSLFLITICGAALMAETVSGGEPGGSPIEPAINEQRMFGIMTDYQTVRDPHATVPPLTVRQKWVLRARQTVDPLNMVSAAMSQMGDADMATQSIFNAGILACVLHQDPRFYRMGPEFSILRRAEYSISRLVVTRRDSGTNTFSSSGIFGMALGIGVSNLYYPSASANTGVMVGRLNTSLSSGVIGNLISEFCLQSRFLHRRHHR